MTTKLYDWRARKALTIRGAAKLAGIGPDHWRNLELGRCVPKPATVERICMGIGATPAQIGLTLRKTPRGRSFMQAVSDRDIMRTLYYIGELQRNGLLEISPEGAAL